jgi:hypothetical protein
MPKLFQKDNNNQHDANICKNISGIDESLLDRKYHSDCEGNIVYDSCQEKGFRKKTGFAEEPHPLASGKIYNDPNEPNKNYIFKYGKGIRGTDDAMLDLFKSIVVIDEDGSIHPVPIMWGSQEKAASYVLQQNVRKDNSLVVDRPVLPLMAINQTGIAVNSSRYVYNKAVLYFKNKNNEYIDTVDELSKKDTIFGHSKGMPVDISYTLYAWTLYLEDMNQILEQIIPKFSLLAYIKVKGIHWQVPVKLESISNNLDVDVGDSNIRVVKYQFNLVAETYIPQPITRTKTVKKFITDIHNSTNQETIDFVYNRIEEEAEE